MSKGISVGAFASAAFFTLGLLLAVLLFNTATHNATPAPFPPLKFLELDRTSTTERVSKALQFKTVSYEGKLEDHPESIEAFVGLREFLHKEYPSVHETLSLEIVNKYSLLYRWDGSNPSLKPYLLMSHLDVVPVPNATKWTYPPFEGRVEEGYIWGRGALDDKMGVIQILEAIEILIKEGFEPKRTVYLSFGHDEEASGYQGNGSTAKLLADRKISFEFVLDEGSSFVSGILAGMNKPIASIALAEKGYVSFELEVRSNGGHSSIPPPEGSISILANAINKIQQNPMPSRLGGPTESILRSISPHMGLINRIATSNLWLFGPIVLKMLESVPTTNAIVRTTIFPTIINAGIKDNVIPDKARAVLNSRILPGDTIDGVLTHVRTVINDPRVDIQIRRNEATEPSEISSTETEGFKMIAHTIGQLYPESVVAPAITMGATDGRWYQQISPKAVYRFSPMELLSSDLSRIHGVDERISVDNHIRAISFYYYLIRNAESIA